MRISSMTAALGIAQLQKIDHILSQRRADAEYYQSRLTGISGISVPKETRGSYAVYQLFSVQVKKRDRMIKALEKEGIMTKVYFSPVHKTHYYQNVLGYSDSLPVTEAISEEILSLPFYPGILRSDLDTVINTIEKFSRMR